MKPYFYSLEMIVRMHLMENPIRSTRWAGEVLTALANEENQ